MLMTGQELVTQLRETYLDDLHTPPYWSDSELLRNLNYAEVQACRRAHLLIDRFTANDAGTSGTSSTSGQRPLCKLTLVANQATYYLSPKILMVKRCQLTSMSYPLNGPVSTQELDERQSGWWGTSGTVGTAGSGGYPDYFINEPGNTITLYPAPSKIDTAYLIVSRIPLTPFTLTTSPEIDERHHMGLCDWAAHLAFMKPGENTINLNLAKVYEDSFTRNFGLLPDSNAERIRRTLAMNQRMRPRVFGS
jgi:hypothetical protein